MHTLKTLLKNFLATVCAPLPARPSALPLNLTPATASAGFRQNNETGGQFSQEDESGDRAGTGMDGWNLLLPALVGLED